MAVYRQHETIWLVKKGMSMRLGLLAVCCVVACQSSAAQERVDIGNERTLLVGHPFHYMGREDDFTAGANIADFDGDGDLDVAFINGRHWPQADELYLNRGDGRLLESREIGALRSTGYGGCAADLDGDGTTDLLVPRDGLPPVIYLSTQEVALAHTRSLGRSAVARGCAVADFTGDAIPDAVIGQRGDATFLIKGPLTRESASEDILTGPVVGVSSADLDADGRPDLILSLRGQATGAVSFNKGAGGFSDPVYFGDEDMPSRDASAADWDGDGDLDIVAAVLTGENHVFVNEDGAFDRSVLLPETAPAQSVDTADFDGDGRPDAVFGTEGANALVMNRASGPVIIALPDEEADTYDVATGDLNGDGNPDIVFANSGAPNVVIYSIHNSED